MNLNPVLNKISPHAYAKCAQKAYEICSSLIQKKKLKKNLKLFAQATQTKFD